MCVRVCVCRRECTGIETNNSILQGNEICILFQFSCVNSEFFTKQKLCILSAMTIGNVVVVVVIVAVAVADVWCCVLEQRNERIKLKDSACEK